MILALAAILLLAAPQMAEAQLPEILVERRLAEQLPLAIGDTVHLRALASEGAPLPFRVGGVHERAADPSRISRNEPEVRLQLSDLEALLPDHDRVDRFAVTLDPEADQDSVIAWIESLAYGAAIYPTEALADEASTTFRVISRFHDAIGAVTILASGVFLLCVMLIRVDERRRDMGLLRLMGVSRGTVFRTIVLEAVAIAVAGSIAGAILGTLIAGVVNRYFAGVYDTTLRFATVTPDIIIVAMALGLVLGIGAGVLAALRISRTAPRRLGEGR